MIGLREMMNYFMFPICSGDIQTSMAISFLGSLKNVQGGIPKSDLLGVTVALIHVAGQRFLAV